MNTTGNLTEGTAQYTGVPADRAAALKQAIADAVTAHGGEVTRNWQRTLSPELDELGLSDTLNANLVSEGIDTVEHLSGCTEVRLLKLKGKVSYASLRTIILKLAKRILHLEDSTTALDDLVELLYMADVAYAKLKKAGYHSIAQVAAADSITLRGAVGSDLHKVESALKRHGLTWAPLHPGRALADLRLPRDLKRVLTAVGLPPETLIAGVTVDVLHDKLEAKPEALTDGTVDDYIRWVHQIMSANGIELN